MEKSYELFARAVPDEADTPRPRDMFRFLAVDILAIVILKLTLELGLFGGVDRYIAAALAAKGALGAYLVWLIARRKGAWRLVGAVTRGRWWAWALTPAAYAVCLPILEWATRWNALFLERLHRLAGQTYHPEPQEAVAMIFSGGAHPAAWGLLLFFIVLAGPVMEELAFRGMGLSAFGRESRVWGVVATSLFFGLYHFSLQSFVPLSLFGAFLALLRLASGTLWCPVLAHCLHNAVVLSGTAMRLGE